MLVEILEIGTKIIQLSKILPKLLIKTMTKKTIMS